MGGKLKILNEKLIESNQRPYSDKGEGIESYLPLLPIGSNAQHNAEWKKTDSLIPAKGARLDIENFAPEKASECCDKRDQPSQIDPPIRQQFFHDYSKNFQFHLPQLQMSLLKFSHR